MIKCNHSLKLKAKYTCIDVKLKELYKFVHLNADLSHKFKSFAIPCVTPNQGY